LKHQQRDLTPVLRRPVEPAEAKRTNRRYGGNDAFDPEQKSANQRFAC
jgi:hypothetical protein